MTLNHASLVDMLISRSLLSSLTSNVKATTFYQNYLQYCLKRASQAKGKDCVHNDVSLGIANEIFVWKSAVFLTMAVWQNGYALDCKPKEDRFDSDYSLQTIVVYSSLVKRSLWYGDRHYGVRRFKSYCDYQIWCPKGEMQSWNTLGKRKLKWVQVPPSLIYNVLRPWRMDFNNFCYACYYRDAGGTRPAKNS